MGGVVTKLLPEDGYGFIETPDGREVYFHAKCILDVASDQIGISSEVRFVEEVGEKGLQATSVRLIERHHHLIE